MDGWTGPSSLGRGWGAAGQPQRPRGVLAHLLSCPLPATTGLLVLLGVFLPLRGPLPKPWLGQALKGTQGSGRPRAASSGCHLTISWGQGQNRGDTEWPGCMAGCTPAPDMSAGPCLMGIEPLLP